MRGAMRLALALPRHEAAGQHQPGVVNRIGDRSGIGGPLPGSGLRELAYPSPGVTESEDS